MSLLQKMLKTVVKFMPDKEADPLIHSGQRYVGHTVSRVDGSLKVKGEATFAAEYNLENSAYASVVCSTIAKGQITRIDTGLAEVAPGVIAVITHKNAPKMHTPITFDPGGDSKGSSAYKLAILQDESIYWDGQPVAMVVAESQDQADEAAAMILVAYEQAPSVLSFDQVKAAAQTPDDVLGEPAEVKIGEAEAMLKQAPVRVDHIYRTPRYNHNAIEPHAAVAVWREDELIVFETSQYVTGSKYTLAEIFGLKPDKVHIVSPFVGGGFGSKGSLWGHTVLCVAAAKVVKRPVKLALSRAGVFRMVGGRTLSEQRVALGASNDGKFMSIIHSGITATTQHRAFKAEQFTFPVRHLYAADHFYIGQKMVSLNTVPNTFMRAPGESIGTFALESAIDELAYHLALDPIELRRLNEPKIDPVHNTTFSMRNLMEAYRRGAKRFGWKHKLPCSQKDGKWLIGQGVATAFYPYYRMPATARVRILASGHAVIQAAAHEMGMGTATVQIQHAAERLGLPLDRVSFEYGNSDLPESPVAGGSNQSASIVASVTAASKKVLKDLFELAQKAGDSPLAELKFEQVEALNGGLYSMLDSKQGESYNAILKRLDKNFIEAEASADAPLETMKYSMASHGAQFCEARIHEDTGEVRISRWLGSFDCGKILNPKTAVSQFRGGIIMGIGMALTEETLFDERRGRIISVSLADYHIPVNLDVPEIDIIFNDIPDEHTPLGVHGIGEIGITGAAAAVANAVYNATGKRIRALPITLDKLLE